MIENKTLVPWFRRGDIGGMAYAITNNIVNYLIVIATLSGVLGWPDEIVFGYVIPGMSVGLYLVACTMHIWLANCQRRKAVLTSLLFRQVFQHRLCS